MDIITHGISGIAVGTVAAGFTSKGLKNKLTILFLSGFAAILPDFDAISLWSKFDETLGTWLHLQHSGKDIYFSKFWYSHHGFLHSIAAALLITFLLFILRYLMTVKHYTLPAVQQHYSKDRILLMSFFFAFLIHLIEDMPTPTCVWGGVAFFWPSKIYWGGTGDIWWWNNYDIFLIIVLVILINILILLSSPWLKEKTGKFTAFIFLMGFLSGLIQIKTRGFDFNYVGHQVDFELYEKKSKRIQRDLLGEKVYAYMVRFDQMVKVNF